SPGIAMEFDHILVARILFTLVTIGWAVLTVVADFNKTHATNPAWTPHARFHVVWQISSYVGFGLLAFALIWWPGALAVERLYLGNRNKTPGAGQKSPPHPAYCLPRYSMKTSWRRLRIIGRAAITNSPTATAISPAEIGRVRNTVTSPRAISIARRRFSSMSG